MALWSGSGVRPRFGTARERANRSRTVSTCDGEKERIAGIRHHARVCAVPRISSSPGRRPHPHRASRCGSPMRTTTRWPSRSSAGPRSSRRSCRGAPIRLLEAVWAVEKPVVARTSPSPLVQVAVAGCSGLNWLRAARPVERERTSPRTGAGWLAPARRPAAAPVRGRSSACRSAGRPSS